MDEERDREEIAARTTSDVAEEHAAEEQPVKNTVAEGPQHSKKGPKPKWSTKKKAIVWTAVAIVVLIAGVGTFLVTDSMAKQQRELELQQQAVDEYNGYIDNCHLITTVMIGGAADAETLCNTISNVWNSAIFEDNQSEWDPDIQQYYAGTDDFNDSLALLFSDQTVIEQQSGISDSQTRADTLMRELINPPEGCESAYNEIKDFYTAFTNLTNLATSPNGSLQSFREDFQEYDSECVSAFNIVNTSIPEKKPDVIGQEG